MPIISLLFAMTLNTSPDSNLTLNDCFLKAVEKSYVIANQGESLKQAEEVYLQARQNFMPALSVNGSGYSSQTQSAPLNGGLELSLSQPIFRGFKSIAILEQSKSLIKEQKEAWNWAYDQLYLDSAIVFYNLVNIRKQLEHIRNQVGLYNEQTKEIESWVKIGRSRASDLSSAKAAWALSYSQQAQMEGELSNVFELFQFLTGVSNFTTLVSETNLPGNLPEINQFLKSMEERPDLKAAKAQSFSTKKAIDIEKSEQYPWADLAISAGNSQLINNISWNWNIQLSLTYSLFSGTYIQSRIRQAESLNRQSDSAYQYLYNGIQRDIRISYASLLSDINQINTIQEALQYLKTNYQLMEKDYKVGAVKITDVLSAYSSYEDSFRTLDSLIYSAQLEWLRLRIYSGEFQLPEDIKL